MNKTELIDIVAKKGELTKKDAEKAVNAFTDTIAEALKNGEKIQIVNFGTFECKVRAARTGRNLRTGAAISIPESKYPAFSAGKGLKDAVAE